MANNIPKVLIVSDSASLRFGGEASIPFRLFQSLRRRGIEAWLVTHERTRDELEQSLKEDIGRVCFVADTFAHRFLWHCSKLLPSRLAYFSLGFVLRFVTQLEARRIAKELVRDHGIDLVHQPIPVSPREPSAIYGMGVPVIIGPMNGAMAYPRAFRNMQPRSVDMMLRLGRILAYLLNLLIPGKRNAVTLLVANKRTERALPTGLEGRIIEMPENGVDVSVWLPRGNDFESEPEHRRSSRAPVSGNTRAQDVIKFVFVGRLVRSKAVDMLVAAFNEIKEEATIELEIIGDGPERTALEKQVKELGFLRRDDENEYARSFPSDKGLEDRVVRFCGWLEQVDCARRLSNADGLVFPCLLECGGAAVLEAMASGLPVIAANWGGPADYVDESTGILIEPSSKESFIAGIREAMTTMIRNPELRRKMGGAGRQRVLDNFDWEANIDAMLEIYRGSIARYRPPHTHSASNHEG